MADDAQDYQDYLEYQEYLKQSQATDSWEDVAIGPPAAVPERSWSDTAANLGKSFARGAVGLGSFVSGFAPMEMAKRISGIPTAGDQVEAARQRFIGDPQYADASTVERYAGAAAEAAPGAALGGGLLSALLAGVGGEAASDIGLPRWSGNIVGGVAPSVGSGLLKAATAPFTKSGQQDIAAKIVKTALGEEGTKRIANMSDDAANLTVAEIAQAPGAANLQAQMAKEIGEGNLIDSVLTKRGDARLDAIKRLAPDSLENVTMDVRGGAIRRAALDTKSQADDALESVWSGVTKQDVSFDVSGAARRVKAKYEDLINPLGFSSRANKLVNYLAEAEGKGLTVNQYQKLRSAAGEVMADAASKGQKTEAALMAQLRQSIDEAANTAADSSVLNKPELQTLRGAIKDTATHKRTYEAGAVGDVLRRGEMGFQMNESSIPQRIAASPEAAKQFVQAFGKNQEAMTQARAGMIDIMARQKPDTWPKFFKAKEPQFKALFGEDYSAIKRVIDDLASEEGVKALAQKATGRGSITTQGMTTIDFLRKQLGSIRQAGNYPLVFGGLAGTFGGPAVGAAGVGIGYLARQSETAIKQAIAQMLVDPALTRIMLQKPSGESVQRIANALAQSLAISQSRRGDER